MTYLDTGCLVKLYYPEPESLAVATRVSGKTICYSPLHELEVTNALHLKVFQGSATLGQLQHVMELIASDLAAGLLRRPPLLWEDVYRDSAALSRQHTASIGCRSLDVLHCAAAKTLDADDSSAPTHVRFPWQKP